MSLPINLENKVVLITGATMGIGAGITRMFARAGAKIAGCARAKEDSREVSDWIETLSDYRSAILYRRADVTQPEELRQMTEATIEKYGRIDILVSNAGVNSFSGAAECDEEQWKHNLDLNLTSHWHLAKLCKPWLEKADPGVIILMSSNHAFHTIPGCFPYNVTKTALTGMVRSLAIEWGPKIRTLGLAPGFIDTPGNQSWFDSFVDPGTERQRTIDLHPVKKIGTPEEVGAWCAFLSSEYAAFASGTTYLLDGGRSALMQDS